LLISVAILLATTLPVILSGNFPFVFDMGRDLLWVRNMIELKRPTLIGPWGSIAGVYFGPMWFYLLAVPYILFNGDPRGVISVLLLANISTIVIGWRFLRQQKHEVAANVFAFIYSTSPLIINTSSFAFHANVLPLVTLLFIIGLYNFDKILVSTKLIQEKKRKDWLLSLPLAALMSSLAFHFEPAAGVMLTGFLMSWVIWQTGKPRSQKIQKLLLTRLLTYSAILFIIPFLPQVVFEMRHGFIQTKSLISYFTGENSSLGGVLPLTTRISERVTKLSGTLTQSVMPIKSTIGKWLFLWLFVIIFLTFARKFAERESQNKDRISRFIVITSFLILGFHYLAYSFLFSAELKGWYLYGLVIIYLLPIALLLEKLQKFGKSASYVVITIMMVNAARNINSIDRFWPNNSTPKPPETVASQLEVVNWLYQDAKSEDLPFAVYTYTPPVYDYQYQYLIWWRGDNFYHMLPAEFSYLPGETSYLPDKASFTSADWVPEDAKLAYLIIEPDDVETRVSGWLGHFSELEITNTFRFSSGIMVEKRTAK
jgi:hypothetical protein